MLESFRLDVPKLDFKELRHDIGSLFAPNKIVLRGKETGKKWFARILDKLQSSWKKFKIVEKLRE